MKHKKNVLIDNVHPNLLLQPHIVDDLVRFFLGDHHPNPPQRKEWVAHLFKCSYCRTMLIVLLSIEKKFEQNRVLAAQQLLNRFIKINQEMEARRLEHLGAYAEVIIAEGQYEAERRFPILAEHMKKCPDCRVALDDTLVFLHVITQKKG